MKFLRPDGYFAKRRSAPARFGVGCAVAYAFGASSAGAQPALLFARPIGGWTSPGYAAGGAVGGVLIAVEGGFATTLPADRDSAHGSLTFGARGGWQFENGLALHVRYDDLGVHPASLTAPLQLATAGLRYSLPFFVPLPFAEVDAGAAFLGADVTFGASAGLGLSIPLGAHVLIDAVGRDWLVPIDGELRQTITASLGLTVTFAAPSH